MSRIHRDTRLLPTESFPLEELLGQWCLAVDEALLPGFHYETRSNTAWSLIHTSDGRSDYRIDGEACTIRRGSLLIIPQGVPFSERVPEGEPCHNRYLMLIGPLADSLAEVLPSQKRFAFWERSPLEVARALDACVALALEEPPARPWKLAEKLCHLIDQLHICSRETLSPRRNLEGAVRRVLEDEPDTFWTVRAIAERLNMSESSLAHRFRAEAGLPPARFIRRERCRQASELLRSGCSVGATAERLGFANAYHFSRVFKSGTGQAPSKLLPSPSK